MGELFSRGATIVQIVDSVNYVQMPRAAAERFCVTILLPCTGPRAATKAPHVLRTHDAPWPHSARLPAPVSRPVRGASGHYQGKPSLFGELQTLENPALRAFLKLDPGVQGIVVHRMYDKSEAEVLHPWDVITSIADVAVDDEGLVKMDSDQRLFFAYEVQKVARNGTVPLTVVRAGKTLHVDFPVSPHHPMLIESLRGDYPRYFIYGPLVFSTATHEFVSSP